MCSVGFATNVPVAGYRSNRSGSWDGDANEVRDWVAGIPDIGGSQFKIVNLVEESSAGNFIVYLFTDHGQLNCRELLSPSYIVVEGSRIELGSRPNKLIGFVW